MATDEVHDRAALECERCGYDLRGLQQPRCPECGKPFDPTARDLPVGWYAGSPLWSWMAMALWCASMAAVVLSLAIQKIAYGERTGPRSREWIVHNLPAPRSYILWTATIPTMLSALALAWFTLFLMARQPRGPHRDFRRRILGIVAAVVIILHAVCLRACLEIAATLGD